MNILIFSWRDIKHPLAGGAEQVMHEHAKGWIENGHKVTHFGSIFKDAKSDEVLDGVKIIRRGSYFLTVQLWAALWYFFSKHENFDIVIDEFHGIPFFTPFYITTKKLAVLQEVAKEIWWYNPLPKPFNWLIGFIGYVFEPLVFLFYKHIPFMVGSQSAKDDLVNIGLTDEYVNVVPHGVIVNAPKKLPDKEAKKTVVFLGALARDKGIEDAINTFSILDNSGDYNFWVMGGGDSNYLSFLKKLVGEYNLEKKIKFFGRVNENEKFERLAKAHVLINPSVREGWGLVNIEANSVGTPVVAYRSQGLIDSVRDGQSGILCSYNTPEDMSRNIQLLLKDKNYYHKLVAGALSWAKQFSWDKSRKLSLKLLEEIVNK